MSEQKIERRFFPPEDAELRVSDDNGKPPHVVGYAARFNKDSLDLGGFIESIKPGAFDSALKNSDVRGLKNHDPNLVLGRVSAGTMGLVANSRGLKYDIEAPDTTTGRDAVEEIRRGDITGSSFSFVIAEDGDDWVEKDGVFYRTITEVLEVFDVGPVTFPAYPDTSAATRSLTNADVALESLAAFKESRGDATGPPEAAAETNEGDTETTGDELPPESENRDDEPPVDERPGIAEADAFLADADAEEKARAQKQLDARLARNRN